MSGWGAQATGGFSTFGGAAKTAPAAPAASAFGAVAATPAPSAFGGLGGATGAGAFGTSAQVPAAQTTSFGGAAMAPATGTGGFGTGAASSTPAATSSFGTTTAQAGSFSTMTPTAGFGSTPGLTTTPGIGGGTTAFGGGAAGGGFATAAGGGFQQQQQRMQRNVTLNTLFKDLNEWQQKEIIKIENIFKAPMRAALEEISEDTGKHHVDLHYSLNEVKVLAMKLTNSQNELLSKVGTLKEEVRRTAHDAQRYGRDEIQKIASRQDSYSRHSNLPNSYFRNHLQHLAKQQKDVTGKIEQFDRLMYSVRKALSKRMEESQDRRRGMNSSSTNDLDSRKYVGSKQIHRLIKVQNTTFTAISTTVAELHRETEGLRRDYLRALAQQGHHDDPFKAADNRERADADARVRKVQEVLEDDYNVQGRPPLQIAGVPGMQQQQQQQLGQLPGAPQQQGYGLGAGLGAPAGASGAGGFGLPPAINTGGAGAFGAPTMGGGAFGAQAGAYAGDLARPKMGSKNKKK